MTRACSFDHEQPLACAHDDPSGFGITPTGTQGGASGENVDVRRILRSRHALVVADGKTRVDASVIHVASDMRLGRFQPTEGF